MTSEKNLNLLRRVVNYLFWVLCLLTVIVFFFVAPRLEILLFPVISKFSIDHIEQTERGTEISGVMVKERPECRTIEVTSTTEYANREYPSKRMTLELETTAVRPDGAQYFGPWIMTAPGPPLGPVLIIRVRHRCHFFWDSSTVLYTGSTAEFFSHEQIEGDPPWVKDSK